MTILTQPLRGHNNTGTFLCIWYVGIIRMEVVAMSRELVSDELWEVVGPLLPEPKFPAPGGKGGMGGLIIYIRFSF